MDHPPGLFGWVDLVTTDVEAAKAFYTGLLGWDTEDVPTPMGPAYTMCSVGGKVVAGMGPQPPGMADQGVPSTWNSYVLVEDLDLTSEAVVNAGGSVVMPAMQIMTQGRMAMIADPSGAVCGLWEPRDHQGAEVFNVPGALTWNELETRHRDEVLPFYEKVFGWRFEAGDDEAYRVIVLDAKEGDDKANGGVLDMPSEVPAEVPDFWAVYFLVEDVEGSVARISELGGSITVEPMTMAAGEFVGFEDPTGAFAFLAALPTV